MATSEAESAYYASNHRRIEATVSGFQELYWLARDHARAHFNILALSSSVYLFPNGVEFEVVMGTERGTQEYFTLPDDFTEPETVAFPHQLRVLSANHGWFVIHAPVLVFFFRMVQGFFLESGPFLSCSLGAEDSGDTVVPFADAFIEPLALQHLRLHGSEEGILPNLYEDGGLEFVILQGLPGGIPPMPNRPPPTP